MNTFSQIATAFPFLLLGAEILVKYPHNHGGGIDFYIVPGVVAAIVNACYMIWGRKVIPLRIVALGLFALLLYLCDRFNVVVDYDEWTARGMPEWGTFQR